MNRLFKNHPPRRRVWVKLVSLVLIAAICTVGVVPAGWAQSGGGTSSEDQSQGGTASSAGIQAGSAVCTILYFPFKAAFAIGGGIVGGLAYIFSGGSDTTAKNIWSTSMYGTYIITPDHLRGDKPVRFLGVPSDMDGTPRAEPAPEPTPMSPEPVR